MKRIKRTLSAFLAAAYLALPGAALSVRASTPLADGHPVPISLGEREICAGEGLLIASSTYVPLRSFCLAFGVRDVSWDSLSRTARASAPGLEVRAVEGSTYIEVNGRAFHAPDRVRVVDGVTMIPLRPLARAFGLEVEWEEETASVLLCDSGAGYAKSAEEIYAANDLYWLSRIVAAESGAEPFAGKLAVANVVMNRVASPSFPDTVEGVVFDRKYAVQFTPVANGTIYREPDVESIAAAKLALEGYTISKEILYFLNPRLSTSFWVPQNRPYRMTIGTHDFYA